MADSNLSNPLRYPGSKSSLSGYIALVIEDNLLSGCTIYEPYAGSAAVSLQMVARGVSERAVLVERDPLLYAFWGSVFSYTEELCQSILNLEVSIQTWNDFQYYRGVSNPKGYPLLELGLAGLFFNRTNYSGIIGAGPIGGISQTSDYAIDCRFNKLRIVEQIRRIAKYKDRVDVNFGDALLFMQKHEKTIANEFSFVYVDPPYYIQGKNIYRYYYSAENHKELASYLLARDFPWLVSYDDHPDIRLLYKETSLQPIFMDYSARISRKGRELLISNLVIPPLQQFDRTHLEETSQLA